jgi:hypothetical protein
LGCFSHWVLIIFSLACCWAAALAKEIGITIAGAMLAFDILLAPIEPLPPPGVGGDSDRKRVATFRAKQWRRKMARYAILCLSTLAYIKMRNWVAGDHLVRIYRKVTARFCRWGTAAAAAENALPLRQRATNALSARAKAIYAATCKVLGRFCVLLSICLTCACGNVCACMCVRACVCVCVSESVRACARACVILCVCLRVGGCVYVCACVCVCVCMLVCLFIWCVFACLTIVYLVRWLFGFFFRSQDW